MTDPTPNAPVPTPLSPAAQAVRMDISKIMRRLQVHCKVDYCPRNPLPITIETDEAGLEAAINDLVSDALCAVADQAIPMTKTPWGSTLVPVLTAQDSRERILDIATELKDHQ